MNLKSFTQFIGSQGWSFHGVCSVERAQKALDEHRKVFEAWIAQGHHAGMDYLPRMAEDRFNLRAKLPGANSAIVLAAWYHFEQKNCSKSQGRIARYAVGRDYHKVLKKKLIQLSDWLKTQDPNAETFFSVDSGPLVDRVLAEAAGLGFFGQNACLISPSRGSAFFIASLLTTAELPETPTTRMPNCGDCTRCQTACPTGALKCRGVVDANRCISYLTIENKGAIPVELRSKIGNRLFGCDACQEVCPFNQGRAHHQVVLIDDLKADRGVGESLSLAELLSIRKDEGFLARFAGTPLMRAKRVGLLRNACVVAGNSGDKTLIPHLERLIAETDNPMIREHAEWAIHSLKCES